MRPDPRPGTEVWIARELGISRMSLHRYRNGHRPTPIEITEQLRELDERAAQIRQAATATPARKENRDNATESES